MFIQPRGDHSNASNKFTSLHGVLILYQIVLMPTAKHNSTIVKATGICRFNIEPLFQLCSIHSLLLHPKLISFNSNIIGW